MIQLLLNYTALLQRRTYREGKFNRVISICTILLLTSTKTKHSIVLEFYFSTFYLIILNSFEAPKGALIREC